MVTQKTNPTAIRFFVLEAKEKNDPSAQAGLTLGLSGSDSVHKTVARRSVWQMRRNSPQ